MALKGQSPNEKDEFSRPLHENDFGMRKFRPEIPRRIDVGVQSFPAPSGIGHVCPCGFSHPRATDRVRLRTRDRVYGDAFESVSLIGIMALVHMGAFWGSGVMYGSMRA